MNRREFGRTVGVAASLAAAPIGRRGPAEEGLGGRIDRALESAMRALIAAQSPDGAWRSTTYGVFKDGLSLTPSVLKALAFGPDVAGAAEARALGGRYLAGRVRADGSIDGGPFGMAYPVYAASSAVLALARLPVADGPRVRSAWLRELRGRQVAEDLGWSPADPAFGGWGYSADPPRKGAGSTTVDADISSTLFAVGALRASGSDSDDPAIRKALGFVRRCQNHPEDGRLADPGFDDGGFFFSPVDPARNKAGRRGEDRYGRPRYHSYGSATADGLRALMRCGLGPASPRVAAARLWLERHFQAAVNPGDFEPNRRAEREGTFYYYAWSSGHAARLLTTGGEASPRGIVRWAAELAEELLRRRGDDGTWSNRFTAAKEDDPLVATPFAAGAMGNARAVLTRS